MREYVSEGLHVQKLEISAISSAYPKYCHVSVYFSTSRHHTMFANLKLNRFVPDLSRDCLAICVCVKVANKNDKLSKEIITASIAR